MPWARPPSAIFERGKQGGQSPEAIDAAQIRSFHVLTPGGCESLNEQYLRVSKVSESQLDRRATAVSLKSKVQTGGRSC